MTSRIAFKTHGFALVVCRNLLNGKYLAVKESKGRGWWLPAGHVDGGQNFVEAAIRETIEEAGVQVEIKGVLAVEHTLSSYDEARLRVIFYAEPRDPSIPPKSIPDAESDGAEWKSVAEIEQLADIPPPHGLRAGELLQWSKYIESGGLIAPIAVREDKRGRTVYEGFFRQENEGPTEVLRPVFSTTAADTTATSIANPNTQRGAKQWSLLHHSVSDGNIEEVRRLLLNGADASATTHKGRTPLHFAISRGDLRITRLLLLSGTANVSAKDIHGHTAIDLARNLPDNVPDKQALILLLDSRHAFCGVC